jgi:DNA-binding NtrC family response regulator
MKRNAVEVLIITRSLALQQGLGALLESLPGIANVQAIKDLAIANSWIKAHRPRIVMLDTVFDGNALLTALETIKGLSPKTQRILLVDQVSELRWVPQYAEAILIKGAPASAVATIVSNLLISKGDKHEHNDSDP